MVPSAGGALDQNDQGVCQGGLTVVGTGGSQFGAGWVTRREEPPAGTSPSLSRPPPSLLTLPIPFLSLST